VWICQPLGPDDNEFTVTSVANHLVVGGKDANGTIFKDHIIYAKGDFGATVDVQGKCYRLDGSLALIRQEGGKEKIHLFDAESLKVEGSAEGG